MTVPHLRLLFVRHALALGAACAFCACGGGSRVAGPVAPRGFTPGPVTTISVLSMLTPPHTLRDIEVGDHDADGKIDLACVLSTTFMGAPSLFLQTSAGTGDGTFPRSYGGSIQAATLLPLLATGDVLGVGSPGFVVAWEAEHDALTVLTTGWRVETTGTRGVGGTEGWTGTLAGLAVGDWSGDGIDDVAIADAGGGQVVAYLSLGESGLAPPQSTSLPAGLLPTGLVAESLTGDTRDDVVVLLGSSGYVVLASGGSGHFVLDQVVPLGAGRSLTEAVTGDFDGDGHEDVAGVVSQPGEPDGLGVLLGNGGGRFAPLAFTTLDAALGTTALRHLHAGDIDGDGRDDLAFVAPALDRVVVALSSAAGGFTFAADADLVGGAADALGLGDVDLDGDLDLLVGAAATLTIRVLLNDRL